MKDYCSAVSPVVSLQWQYPDNEDTKGDGQYKEYGREVLYWGEDEPVSLALAEIFADPVTDDTELTITKEWDSEWGETTITMKQEPAMESNWLTTGTSTEALILKQTEDGTGRAVKNAETDSRLYVLDMAQIREDWLGRDQDANMDEEAMNLVRTQVRSALRELAELPDGFTAESITLTDDADTAFVLGYYSGEDESIRSILTVDVVNGGIRQETNSDTVTGALLDSMMIFSDKESEDQETDISTVESYDETELSDLVVPELEFVQMQNGAMIFAYSDGSITVMRSDASDGWQVWLQTSAEESFALPDRYDPDGAVCASDGVPLICSSMDTCRYLFDGDRLIVVGMTQNADYYRGEYQNEWEDDYDCSVVHGVFEICAYTSAGLQYRGLAELQGRGHVYLGGWSYDEEKALELSETE